MLPGEGPIFPSLMDQSSLSRSDLVDEKPGGEAGHGSPRDPATNKYSCGRCGRSYLHQATLVRHQRYECGITASYPCQVCGRKFKRRDNLKKHMDTCSALLLSQSELLRPTTANSSINMEGNTSLASAMVQSENYDLEAEIRSVFEDIDDENTEEAAGSQSNAETSHGHECLDLKGQQMQQSGAVANFVCPLEPVHLNCTHKQGMI